MSAWQYCSVCEGPLHLHRVTIEAAINQVINCDECGTPNDLNGIDPGEFVQRKFNALSARVRVLEDLINRR